MYDLPSQIGPYRVEAEIGPGAIKILPEEVTRGTDPRRSEIEEQMKFPQ